MSEAAARRDRVPTGSARPLEAPEAEPSTEDAVDAEPSKGFSTFRSLRYRDYRLIWIGTLFASSGQWIQQVTLGWLVYQMTGSGFLLGAINGARSVPLLFLGPLGGVAADRVDRKKLMLGTQVFLMVTAAMMATVIVTGHLQVWHLFVFTLMTGVAWAFNMPVRQSVVPNLVPPKDLMNALALNSAGFNVTRILGPTLAGVLIAQLGPSENFWLQAAAYLGVTITVMQLTIPPTARASGSDSVMENLKEGAGYVWNHATLRTQMTLALVPVVVALPYVTLLPIFAQDVLGKGAGGFGVLMSAPGIGAVIGTLTIASLGNMKRKGYVLLASIFALGTSLILFSLSRSFALSFVLLIAIGAFQMAYLTTNQTLLQLTIPDELRGRVMGIYMLNQGLLPLGSLFAGGLADAFGAPAAVMAMGAIVCALSVAFLAQAKSLRAL